METLIGWTITVVAYARTFDEAQEISQNTLPDLSANYPPCQVLAGGNKGLFCVNKKLEVTEKTKDKISQDLKVRLRAEPRVVEFAILVGKKTRKPFIETKR